ncbi:hypothetical protein G3A39_02760 [Paraburkholderia aspalathi]|uniref:hypothetical protein n=1 Tax=Paraburkholderia nemoris TaxID=2793076 RepID=UPI00190B39D6|nr:hypothetical protein [Paraburkholderia nemoris]MBK3738129.1 hypothetical protein [Paraburkholderia aspalathi]
MIKLENRDQFMSDWIRIAGDYARDYLGFETPKNHQLAHDQLLANNFERVPKKRRREIRFADSFVCPDELKTGWEYLKAKIEAGDDLYPHLSRQIKKIQARDPLLMHWSINHFHLGTEPDSNHKGLIQGGKEIVYAHLDDKYFYAIAVLPHGHWEDFDLIETIKRNWPTHPNISTRMTLATNYTKEDVLELRKHQINAPASFGDGSFYIGLGQNLAGFSASASLKANSIRRLFGRCQAEFEKNFHTYLPDIEIKPDTHIVAHVRLEKDHSFSVSLPDLSRSIKLDIGTIEDLIEGLKA